MSWWLRGVAVLAATVTVGVGVPAASGASAVSAGAVPMCQGHRATIVGDHTSTLMMSGTEGDDVIVTRGRSFRAKGGDDLICVTGGTTFVDAGAGDDRVVVTSSPSTHVQVILGTGQDVYRGGAGADWVDAEPQVTYDGPHVVDELDRVSTRGGNDSVNVGAPGQTTQDVVDLGDGSDQLHVSGVMGPDVRPQGGAGTDVMHISPNGLDSSAPRRGDWTVDNALGTATVDGVLQSRWASFEQFWLGDLDAETARFVGGDADELVSAGPDLVSATMGGGDDWFSMAISSVAPRPVTLSGGPGRDMVADAARELTIDLAAGGLWEESAPQGDPQIRLDSVENADGYAGFLRINGDAQDNVLRAYGCDVVVTGGAGADRLRAIPANPEDECQGLPPGVDFSGGAGADVLLGGPGPDHLDGGEDRDVAAGRGGTDVCLAEVRRTCEH